MQSCILSNTLSGMIIPLKHTLKEHIVGSGLSTSAYTPLYYCLLDSGQLSKLLIEAVI